MKSRHNIQPMKITTNTNSWQGRQKENPADF